jgi:hypothetical protein
MEHTIMVFLILMFAHLLADYPLQGDFLAKMKGQNMIALASHAGIWTGCIAVAGMLVGFDVTLFDIVWLFGVHAFQDYAKANPVGIFQRVDPLGKGLLLDQSVHVLQIVCFMALHMGG